MRTVSVPPEWREDFREYQRLVARRLTVVCAVMALIVIPFFQLVDVWSLSGITTHWWSHLGWRLPPMVLAIGILVLRWRVPEGRWPRPVLIAFALSGMIMVTGMVAEHLVQPSDLEALMTNGLVVVIALVAVLATAGARDLLLIYGPPLITVIAFLAYAPVSLFKAFLVFVHPLMMMVMGVVLSEFFYRIRREAFVAREQLAQSASTDVLTGLSNRRAFDSRLEAEHARCSRFGTPYALIMIDLDHFKDVNDTYGHEVGDEVLRELAQRLSDGLRTEDEVGRWGGEEFMVLLPGASKSPACTVASKLRRAVAQEPFVTSAGSIPITTSLGVAVFNGEHMASMVARRADVAMYAAKNNGRNRYECA
ncbi:GGDEF domain-containing protein [Halomonadaceae bacterium KBTZ08]